MKLEQIKQAFLQPMTEVYGFAELTKYAILVPLVEIDGEMAVLFEVRAHTLRRQPGEICFPGGKVEAEDLDEYTSAIRETCEELGLSVHDINWVGNLGILVPPVQIAIYTYIGFICELSQIQFSVCEVAEIFTVPLHDLLHIEPKVHDLQLNLNPLEGFPFELIPGGKDYKFRERKIPEYFYVYNGRIIWGLTARILKQFMDHLKKTVK